MNVRPGASTGIANANEYGLSSGGGMSVWVQRRSSSRTFSYYVTILREKAVSAWPNHSAADARAISALFR